MKRTIWLAAALLLVIGCAETKLYHAEYAKDGEGMRVEVKGGTFSGGAGAALENVGSYTSVPAGWKGPVPPGWAVYESDPDEEPTPTPPTE